MDYTSRDATTGSSAGQTGMVTAVFRDRDSAERAYDALLRRGYTKDEVNVLMTDQTRDQHFKNSKTGETRDTEL
jgi:hypothetical protein